MGDVTRRMEALPAEQNSPAGDRGRWPDAADAVNGRDDKSGDEDEASSALHEHDADVVEEPASDGSTGRDGEPKRKGGSLRYWVCARAIGSGEERRIAMRPTLGQGRKLLAQCKELMGSHYLEFWLERVQRIEF
jgi:hypothetical protein